MTAEIAIMNKEAIALASDSAITMTRESGKKIFTSANKLFTLSKYQPVGIMVYGNAIFMGVPWETIIKIYRNSLGKAKFNTVEDYADDFIGFLDDHNPLFPKVVQERYIHRNIYGYFGFIKSLIKTNIRSIIDKEGQITREEITQIVSEVIDEHFEKWENTDQIPSVPQDHQENIFNEYGTKVNTAIDEVFEELPVSDDHLGKLRQIATSLFSKFLKKITPGDISGVVIAGFGEGNAFPSLRSFMMEGIALDKLKYKEDISGQIDFETDASIIPFAQRDMVATFMEGVDPNYRSIQEHYLSRLFDQYGNIIVDNLEKYTEAEKADLKQRLATQSEDIIEEHQEKLGLYRRNKYVDPVINVVSMLPKDELAEMAESLVNLTSFKRKVTMQSETVGGPIDVAVISKGDGFIWIKRKHYFEGDLNPQFFANYYEEEVDNEEG